MPIFIPPTLAVKPARRRPLSWLSRSYARYISEEAVKQGIDLEGAKREAIEKVDGKIDEIIEEELGSDFKILTDRLRKRD